MASQEGINQDQTVTPGIDQRLQTHTIGETLSGLDQCSVFRDLVRGAGVDARLRLSGLQTLLAPDNRAMDGVKPDDIETFLDAHLLPGAVESFDLRRCKTIRNTAGETLPVQMDGGTIRIGSATIVRSDIACTNGVLHIVDAALSR